MKCRFVGIVLLIFVGEMLFAQEILKGIVLDENGIKLAYCSVQGIN